jgi:hypothetical protein
MKKLALLLVYILLGILFLLNIASFVTIQKLSAKQYDSLTPQDIQNIVDLAIEDIPEPIQPINGVDGKDGRDGRDGQTKIITEQIITEKPTEKARDGKDGLNGRTPIFDVDPDTGDILMRYEGDTMWSVLIEGCKLTKSCEDL